jgi:hypothetical protein
MPRTAALAVASARGFGEFTSALNLTTVTFTSSTTWTAPAYLSNIVILAGKGSAGTSDSTAPATLRNSYVFNSFNVPVSRASPTPTRDWSEFYNHSVDLANTINGSGGVVYFESWDFARVGVDTRSYYYDYYVGDVYATGYAVGGTASINNGYPATSGAVYYVSSGWYGETSVSFTQYFYGGAGTDATGVGKTFSGGAYSGGTGYPATTTTFTNVAVTPGASYSLSIPSGGQISISYYAPA